MVDVDSQIPGSINTSQDWCDMTIFNKLKNEIICCKEWVCYILWEYNDKEADKFEEDKTIKNIFPVEIETAFQPICDDNRAPIKYESLLRASWEHPETKEKNYIRPDKYLEYLKIVSPEKYEKTILNVIKQAVCFSSERKVPITLNFWTVEFSNDEYSSFLKQCCEYYGVQTDMITIEILEEIPASKILKQIWIDKLKDLANKWFGLAIDDCYSNMYQKQWIKDMKALEEEAEAIEILLSETSELIKVVKIDRKIVEHFFPEDWREISENQLAKFMNNFWSKAFHGKQVIFEWVPKGRVNEVFAFFKEYLPKIDFLVQSYATWEPEIPKKTNNNKES